MITSNLLLMLITGLLAGILGSILGIGGGMIVTPILTIAMGLDIKYAIGASIIVVIATSSGATISFLRDDMLNLRVAMFLEIATTIGAVTGAALNGWIPKPVLYVLFSLLLLQSCYNMVKKLLNKPATAEQAVVQPDYLSQKLRLNSSYYDKALKQKVDYQVKNVPGGFLMMLAAGIASGLLGIGSGAFKVIAMDNIMRMPLKPSSATSNLMMGVTAAASATVYFFNGTILPNIAVPLALGVVFGATIGSRIMQHLHPKVIRIIFIPILLYLGLQMFLKGFGVNI
ncbi:sulfite exporter TauE/SafE family protein [Bombilactobacillus thymidiniphilus]|uniref:Probable membrane transporter protein n=1 Tax=Bombilactobacillus thymidiniphilus TaxID=2923363 RepID=A0ABY4PED4_9LACO|nr:sulfite exporter TauE/SafE family protein [Bombilactobacillus thymidiniphilus]UQS84153.1 sulfite exporter TauE/SafE family protein [Bombilactobacillus thymidiniphilus]